MKKIVSAALALAITLSLVTFGTPAAWADTPTQAGKVFAGYYTDGDYTVPANEETEFPRFADEKVLTVKFQLLSGANEGDESTRLRAVTTVDSLNYQSVGMILQVNDGEETVLTATKVATKITGKNGLGALTYEPSTFSEESRYFCAFNFTVANTAFSKSLSFTPYWVTMDGTTVRGEKRTIVISESQEFSRKAVVTSAKVIGTWVYDRVTAGVDANLAPPRAYDGDWTTAWQPQANSNTYEDGEGIIFTLDHAYELTTIRLVAKLKLLWVDIFTSPDGQNWTAQPIYSITNENRSLWVTDGDYRVCTLTGLNCSNAGYVKVEFKGNNTGTASMFFNEAEFYGKTASAAGSYEPVALTISNAEIVGTWASQNDVNLNKTYDGITTNMWNPQATTKYASGEGVVFSLEKTYDLADEATLVFGSRRHYFDLLVSSDGKSYTLARSVSANNADSFYTDDTANKIYTCTLNGLNVSSIRSIKLLFTGDATNSTWVAFREITLTGKAPASEPEIATATITSGTPLGTWELDRVGSASVGPDKAFDADATGTCWNPQAINTAYTSGEGIVFALDKAYDLTKLSFVYNRKHYFQISVSEDGTNYTVIATINSNNAAASYSSVNASRVRCDVNTNIASIQYVKLTFAGNEANNAFVGLFDVSVSGSVSNG